MSSNIFTASLSHGLKAELCRLATFAEWPTESRVSAVILARCGFSYTGQGDKVVCYKCSSTQDGWEVGDDPKEKHHRLFPNCPLAHGNDSDNVPLKLLEQETFDTFVIQSNSLTDRSVSETVELSENVLQALNGLRQLISVYREALRRGNRRGLFVQVSTVIDRTNPDFDRLRAESTRLATFHDWPLRAHAQPADLARDGFFFTGLDDRVQCAFCHGFLRNWVPGDRPAEEHRKHFPECPLVRGIYAGNIVIGLDAVSASTVVCMQSRLVVKLCWYSVAT